MIYLIIILEVGRIKPFLCRETKF